MMFVTLAMLIMAAAVFLSVWQVLTHPTLPDHAKQWIALEMAVFILFTGVPLYLLLGAPQLAVF